MRRSRSLPAMLLASAALLSGSPGARADTTVSAQQRAAWGVETTELAAHDVPRAWTATAEVLDAGALLGAFAELQAARQASAASAAEFERDRQLFENDANVARKVLEAARVQSASDRARVVSLEGQLRSAWGPVLASGDPRRLERLARDLAAGRGALVRLNLTTALPVDASELTITLHALERDARAWPARWLGVLPRGATGAWGGAALVQVEAPWVAGQWLAADLKERRPTLSGWSVPPEAIVRWRGEEWYYEQLSADRFARRGLADAVRTGGEVLVAGERAGRRVVVTQGARSLLAAEQGADPPDEPKAGAD